ncbi:MAG: hypothetical protein WCO33_04680 [bacterium]
MSKGWIIFLTITGLLILFVTGFQIVFFLTPDKNLNIFNPPKADTNFQTEVLQQIYDNQKWVLINNDTLQPNVIEQFTPPSTSSSSSSSAGK